MLIALCNEVLASMPFERQCEFAAATGYDGLELAPFTLSGPGQSLETIDAGRIRRAVESQGLVITGLHWLLVTPEGLSMTHADPAVRKRTLAIISRLNREVVHALRRAEVKERVISVGSEVIGSTPEQLAAEIKSDMIRLGKLIKDAGIRVE